jgi:hypothetical protein
MTSKGKNAYYLRIQKAITTTNLFKFPALSKDPSKNILYALYPPIHTQILSKGMFSTLHEEAEAEK